MSDDFTPETKTEVERGGSGGRRKTAIGSGGGGFDDFQSLPAGYDEWLSANRLNTVICDRSLLIRFGFSVRLEAVVKIVGDACDGVAAVETTRRLRPDLLLLDFDLDGMNGLEVCTTLSKEMPYLRFLVLTDAYHATRYFHQLSRAGVIGFCLKSSGLLRLFEAVNVVALGSSYCDSAIAELVRPTALPVKWRGPALTPRETEVLVRLDLRNKEISEELNLSLKSVEHAIEAILQKLKVPTRTAAALKAIQLGFTLLPKMPKRDPVSSLSEEQILAEKYAQEAIAHWLKEREIL